MPAARTTAARHGTGVAGVALYGDLARCVDTKTFEPSAALINARILDGDHVVVAVHHGQEPEPAEVGVRDVMLVLGGDPDVRHGRREVGRDRRCHRDAVSRGIGADEQSATVLHRTARRWWRRTERHLLPRQYARGAQSEQRVSISVGHRQPTATFTPKE